MDIYESEYQFPSNNESLLENLNIIQDDNFYKEIINKQVKWSKQLYEPFNDKYFIEVLK